MPNYIRIEPAKHFDKAIYKTRRDGYITYDYWGLVEVCQNIYEFDTEDAIEWVEYNILGLNDSNESMFGVEYSVPDDLPKVRRKVGKVRRRKR